MADPAALFSSLGFLQFPLELAEPGKNLDQVKIGLESLHRTDRALIVLPEMWSTGFAYGRLTELAASTAEILRELAGLAGRYNCLLAGSLPELDSSEQECMSLQHPLYSRLRWCVRIIQEAAGIWLWR